MLIQLSKLQNFIYQRRELGCRYSERLSKFSKIQVPNPSEENNVFFRYLVALPEGSDIGRIIRKFSAAEIEVGRGVYPSLHNYLRLSADCFPNAERAMRTLLSI